jgi:hypothetical protein
MNASGDWSAVGFLDTVAPDQLCLERFEECFHHGIVAEISFSAHRDFEAML